MTVRQFVCGLLMVCAGPVQALGLLDAYDLAVRNDPTFQAAIEERARSDMGMVRSDEQFFWVPGVAIEHELLGIHAGLIAQPGVIPPREREGGEP